MMRFILLTLLFFTIGCESDTNSNPPEPAWTPEGEWFGTVLDSSCCYIYSCIQTIDAIVGSGGGFYFSAEGDYNTGAPNYEACE